MFSKLFQALDGYKTYSLLILGLLNVLIGHFWGPVTLAGNVQIPHFDWSQLIQALYGAGLLGSIRYSIGN